MSLEYGLGEIFGAADGGDPMAHVPFSPVPLCEAFRLCFFGGPTAAGLEKLGAVFHDEATKKMVTSAREVCAKIERQAKKGNVINTQQMILDEAKGLAAAAIEAVKCELSLCEEDGRKKTLKEKLQRRTMVWAKEQYKDKLLNKARAKVAIRTAGQDVRPETDRKWDVVRPFLLSSPPVQKRELLDRDHGQAAKGG